MTRWEFLRQIAALSYALEEYERRLLLLSAQRLLEGQKKFGPWIPNKHRNKREALEEHIDATHYVTMELLRMMEGGDEES